MDSKFEQQFVDAVTEAVETDTDHYTQVKYSDEFYLHVQGHPEDTDAFEIDIIVVHGEAENYSSQNRTADITVISNNAEALFDDLDALLTETVGETFDTAYLTEVVDDGTWKTDASVYSTEKITPIKKE